jgi:hypothetical protein
VCIAIEPAFCHEGNILINFEGAEWPRSPVAVVTGLVYIVANTFSNITNDGYVLKSDATRNVSITLSGHSSSVLRCQCKISNASAQSQQQNIQPGINELYSRVRPVRTSASANDVWAQNEGSRTLNRLTIAESPRKLSCSTSTLHADVTRHAVWTYYMQRSYHSWLVTLTHTKDYEATRSL